MRLAPLNNAVVFKKLFREAEILTIFVKDPIDLDLHMTADNKELSLCLGPTNK